MRRVFIQTEDGKISNLNHLAANIGFDELGYEIYYYDNSPPDNLLPSDIVVGFISNIKIALKNLGLDTPTEIVYPTSLNKYWGRKIERTQLKNISEDDMPIFIKPESTKVFDGRLLRDFKDMIGVTGNGDTIIWASEPINILTEWRVFVRYGKIMDVRKYKGDPFQKLNRGIVESAIKDFSVEAPAGFSIDFAMTDTGKTVCIEVNDGYSLGTYGLHPPYYAKLLAARWAELTGTYDEMIMVN